ncbi:ABC transporter permease DevC [Leptothoe spongobia]|uniref:FtsX-like permease family protein n=1 Tax=Leptothoe spongobia TAU-MAC 1115 TaxID=1967444 RepID=A0A947GHG0_9CYAN|nr:FtsX-like permease family protein [Leptothoe spongobia TAU-MAC 1115]
MFRKVPVAWLQLTHNRLRLLVALAGISFAVILIFMQMGLRAALFESAVRLHTNLQGEIFLISPRSTALIGMSHFSERRLLQALAFPEVDIVSPIYVDYGQWKNPQTGQTRQIFVTGFEPNDNTLRLSGVIQQTSQLNLSDTVLFDQASRPEFGSVAIQLEQKRHLNTELEGRQISVVGVFKMGASFGADGNVITSNLNFLRIFDHRAKGAIDIGLIRLKPGSDVNSVVHRMRRYLPKDVRVFTKQELIDFEKNYWQTSTAIGFIFDLGVVIGLIVGIVFVYQVLYTDISHHLHEYATLKAMGYNNNYLVSIVFQESFILAILGYMPGFAMTLGIYDLTLKATLLPIQMDISRAFNVQVLTVFMCFIGGFIAIHQVQRSDPADLF